MTTGSFPSITSFSASCLFRHNDTISGGDPTILHFFASYTSYFSIISLNIDGSTAGLYLWTQDTWIEISGATFPRSTWMGLGVSCAGTGTNQLIISLSTSGSATPSQYTLTLGGPGGTITLMEALFRSVFTATGSMNDMQNLKFGANALTATKLRDEAWNLAIQNTGDWSPIHAPMTSGTLTTQASPFSVYNAGGLTTVAGPLVEASPTGSTLLMRRRHAIN